MKPQFPILLVDDDLLLLDILNRAAARTFPEASFTQVYNATEAITYINGLNRSGPKLVFLDIDLRSNLTGFDFLKFLKTHPQGRLLPIIMLTVDQEPSRIEAAYSMGSSSYIVKPDSFENWKQYLNTLRLYWFNTVTIPPIQFQKLDCCK